MVLPLAASTMASAAMGASNPLAMLASPLAGGLGGFTDSGSAYSSAAQDQLFNMPFNVGSGSISSDPTKEGGGGGSNDVMGQIMPIFMMGVVAWAAVQLLK